MLIKNLIDAVNWRFPISAKAFVEGVKTADEGIYTYILYTCARNAAWFFIYVKINRYFCFVKARSRGCWSLSP